MGGISEYLNHRSSNHPEQYTKPNDTRELWGPENLLATYFPGLQGLASSLAQMPLTRMDDPDGMPPRYAMCNMPYSSVP